MEPLSNFKTKEEALEYYVENRVLSPVAARHFIESNWEKTR
ncbi:MAG: hypothetical protein ACOCP8_05030 [archaeon]